MDVQNRVLTTPFWVFGLRIAQVVLSIVVLGLCAARNDWGIGDAAALGIAAAVFTWFIVAYQVLTEKLAALRVGYHIIAVLVLDLYMIIIWLCTWAVNAARAALYTSRGGVSSDGDSVCYLGYCVDVNKRSIEARAVKYSSLKGLAGGAAGIGAIIWILFIATFAWTILNFLKGRKEGRFPLNTMSSNTGHVEEAKAPATQQPVQPQYTGQEQYQQPMQPQYTGQEQYQQQPMQPQYTGQEQYQQAPVQTDYTHEINQPGTVQQPHPHTQQ